MNKERDASQEKSLANGLITGVVLVAVTGLAIMCGGAIALKKGAELQELSVALFMILTFAIVGFVELFLVRQLTRLVGSGREQKRMAEPAQPLFQPALVPASELRASHLRPLPEPISSVTENTTRTLEHSVGQSLK